jgi:hypothetical protein
VHSPALIESSKGQAELIPRFSYSARNLSANEVQKCVGCRCTGRCDTNPSCPCILRYDDRHVRSSVVVGVTRKLLLGMASSLRTALTALTTSRNIRSLSARRRADATRPALCAQPREVSTAPWSSVVQEIKYPCFLRVDTLVMLHLCAFLGTWSYDDSSHTLWYVRV